MTDERTPAAASSSERRRNTASSCLVTCHSKSCRWRGSASTVRRSSRSFANTLAASVASVRAAITAIMPSERELSRSSVSRRCRYVSTRFSGRTTANGNQSSSA